MNSPCAMRSPFCTRPDRGREIEHLDLDFVLRPGIIASRAPTPLATISPRLSGVLLRAKMPRKWPVGHLDDEAGGDEGDPPRAAPRRRRRRRDSKPPRPDVWYSGRGTEAIEADESGLEACGTVSEPGAAPAPDDRSDVTLCYKVTMAGLLTALSLLTCLVSGWMTVMFLLLRHPHYLERDGNADLRGRRGGRRRRDGAVRCRCAGRSACGASPCSRSASGRSSAAAAMTAGAPIAGALFIARRRCVRSGSLKPRERSVDS